ncbi:GTPase IMAP family member 8-like [Salminus brasiliensis]|uniref:GTPase IMAP family member 8-like n=1 Tax=Salminus brasiliensis TaxID=930266 RepID=UPI003B833FC1
MESDVCPSHQRRRSITPPPNMCEELRVVLLGKNGLNSRVGNFILGRDAFYTEAPPPSVEQHSERAGGTVEGRYITLINTPHLFDPQLSLDQITAQIKKCMTLCFPGPHVLVLVLQPDDFSETDRHRLDHIFSLSEEPHRHTLVVTTQTLQPGISVDPFQANLMKKVLDECSSRHFQIDRGCSRTALMELMQRMVEENGGNHLVWETYEAAPLAKDEPKSYQAEHGGEKPKQETVQGFGTRFPESKVSASTSKTLTSQLTLLLCGRNREVKALLLDLLLDRKTIKSQLALYNSQLSEKEVIKETHHRVPGVHAFLLIVPTGPLTDEDKGELEKFQRTFGSRMKDHTIVIFVTEHSTDKSAAAAWLEQNSQTLQLLRRCGGRYKLLEKLENGNLQPVPALLDELVSMVTSNRPAGPADSEALRIVLIGKTGNGKSATGNAILGRQAFRSSASMTGVTTKCQKGFSKVLGRSVAVVDTPGLFDTTLTNEEVTEEIAKCISLLAPGPHAFIIVLSVGRFTKEEMDTVELIKDIFGPEAVRFSIVLFTRGDELGGETIEAYVERSNHADVNQLITDCGGRVQMFNNKDNNSTQVRDLLRKIEDMIEFDRNNYFTNEVLELAERSIQQRKEEILRQREKEIKTKYNKEVEKKELRLKRDRQRVKEERQQREKGREGHQREFDETQKALRPVHKTKEVERGGWKSGTAHFLEKKREEGEREPRTSPRPAAEEVRTSKGNLKKIIEMFERNTKQDRHPQQSETEHRRKVERDPRRRESEESTLQTTNELEGEGEERKVCVEEKEEEERKVCVEEKEEEERKVLTLGNQCVLGYSARQKGWGPHNSQEGTMSVEEGENRSRQWPITQMLTL